MDQFVSNAGFYEVVDDWDCMLNQTNIGQNNNKYYVIQMLKSRSRTYSVWTRWGRVVSYIISQGFDEILWCRGIPIYQIGKILAADMVSVLAIGDISTDIFDILFAHVFNCHCCSLYSLHAVDRESLV